MQLRFADFNPFALRDLQSPPQVVLAMRLTALALLLKGYHSGYYKGFREPFAPFFHWIDAIPFPDVLQKALTVLFVLSLIGILFDGQRVRYWCAIAAATILIGATISRFYYSNNKIFCACLFFLGAFTAREDRPDFFFAQLSLMYFGAAFNKLFEPDWLSGQYFNYWLGTLNPQVPFLFLAELLPPLLAGKILGWTTIVVEVALFLGFAMPRFRVRAVWLGLYFHSGALLLSQRDFGVYTAAIMASYLVVLQWPDAVTVSYEPARRAHQLIHRIFKTFDADRTIGWLPSTPSGLATLGVSTGELRFTGWAALQRLMIYSAPVSFAAIIFMTISQAQYVWWRSLGLLMALIVFCPLWTYAASRRRQEVAR